MTIPSGSNYPTSADTNENLYLTHDSLRLKLAEDYDPGDTTITIDGDATIFSRFPNTGFITLTNQCNDIDERSTTLYYTSKTSTGFAGIELAEGANVSHPKNETNVLQNVTSWHHNAIKDAIIAIENFIGVKGAIDTKPLGTTMEGRTNFIHKLALTPRAWFKATKTVGLAPFTVTFVNQSTSLGTGCPVGDECAIWDFGDTDVSHISLISINFSTTSEIPSNIIDARIKDTDLGIIKKTFYEPGLYDVTLTVSNKFGEDSITFPNYINVRAPAPDPAVITITNRSGQLLDAGVPSGGPYTTPPTIKSPTNTLIEFSLSSGENPATPGISYGGEQLNSLGQPIDPITSVTWDLTDDLLHPNSRTTNASYSIGGLYDLVLRADTQLGAYRITTYENAINIVEKNNFWLWTFTGSTNQARAHEFGLISESFKTITNAALTVDTNNEFLNSVPDSDRQKKEFASNNAFAPRSTRASGNQGDALLIWASGRAAADSLSAEKISMATYNPFLDIYTKETSSEFARPWNWAALISSTKAYLIFGYPTDTIVPYTSPTNPTKHEINLLDLSVASSTLTASNFIGGASELLENVVSGYGGDGQPAEGHYSVYRTAYKGQTGYILRNAATGNFFRLRSFYKTEGTVSDEFQNIRKLPDMGGSAKTEGQLVSLASGIYFFNNSGSISAYNDTTGSWETGIPGVNSLSFQSLQDDSVVGYDDDTNILVAASDNDKAAYISFDYSANTFIKFNASDTTFSALTSRPIGTQWMAGVF